MSAAAGEEVAERRLTLSGLAGQREARAPVRERLMSMLFLAAIAHAIIILGISFGVGTRQGDAPGMEVLLVTDDLPEARNNEHAAYLAQRTQLGSGNNRDLPTGSPQEQAAAANSTAHEATGEAPADRLAGARAGGEPVLASGAPAPVIRWLGQSGESGSGLTPAELSAAGGETRHGRGDARVLVLRGDPKTGQWLSPDTRVSRLAPYLDAWRRKVERIGTLNFPTAARRPDLSGSPVIEVALAADGRLIEAVLQRGSGHRELDQAALQILRMASPFEPFPPALARDYAALRFAYQWEFVGGQAAAGAVTVGPNGGGGP